MTPKTSHHEFVFPRSTILIAPDPLRRHTYYATDDTIFEVSSGKRHHFSSPNYPEVILISPKGDRLLINNVLMDAATLRPLHRFETDQTWWEGQKPRSLQYTDDLLIADTHGRYFLAAKQVDAGNESNGGCPKHRLSLMEHLPSGKRYRHKIGEASFDGGSTGVPSHFAAWDAQSAVFGLPRGGMTGEDFFCYMLQGKVHQCLKNKNGFDLYFEKQPLRTKNAIVGLACTNDEGLREQASYLYHLNTQKFTIEPVDKRTVLVTTGRQDEVLLGIRTTKGVILEKPKGNR
ncbi:hypothetical protein [Armatimonas sp.]|uniref:hypothetical protein n=1 Tax=Armatimonas sp. TaxID=1872638 RepID=UPI00286D1BC0|nr:hypothetical protein [Armatimonas sp.]